MENVEKRIEKYKTIEKKYMYLVKILQELNYKDKIIVLNCLIKNSKRKQAWLIELKRQYEEYLNTNKVFKYSKEIDMLDKTINLYNDIMKIIKIENGLKNKIVRPNLTVSEVQIKKIDSIIEKNTLSLLKKLRYTIEIEEKLDILYKLKDMYSKSYISINKDQFGKDYKNFKKIYNYVCENIKIENEIKNTLNKNVQSTKDEYYYPHLNLSEEKIKLIDSITNMDTISLFKELDIENRVNRRIEILYLLKEKYLKVVVSYDKDDLGENYKYIKEINRFINDAIRIEHKKKKSNSKKCISLQDDEDELDLECTEILEIIKTNGNLEYYDLASVLKAYKYFIVHDLNMYSINALNVSKYISNKIVNEEIKDDDVIILINSIKDTIKYRLLSLNKDDNKEQLERSLLKELRIVFDFICKNYKEDKLSTKHDYRYDVIKYFLQDENGYPYVKKIINYMPEIVNVRVKEHSNEHIIINILKEYIYNYKEMLKDKNGCFINPDYLKQVYLLFMNNSNLKLNFEDKVTIDYILDDFILYLDKEIYKEDRKTLAKKEVRKLKSQYLYYEKKLKFRKVDERQLRWQTELLSNNRTHCLKKDNRVNVLDDCITLNGINAYSLSQDGDKRKLKIHVIDTSKIVAPYTSVDSKIYNCMIEHEKISENIKRKLTLKYNEENPTITYEFNIEKGNCITDFKIYKSKIFIDEENNTLLKNLSQLSKKILASKNIKDFESYTIDESIEILLNEEFINYIDENKLPFIYCGKEYINDYINHMNNLSNIFNRLNVIDFKKLYTIISNNVGEYNYSTKAFEVDGTYNLNLINDINYLFIFNQRLITDIIFNNQKLKDKSKYLKECEKLEHELNLSINHIKPEDIVFKNNAKRNKLKQFNL